MFPCGDDDRRGAGERQSDSAHGGRMGVATRENKWKGAGVKEEGEENTERHTNTSSSDYKS